MSRQTVIPLGSVSDHALTHFVIGGNAELHALLIAIATASGTNAQPRLLYIWGDPGCGKTHLLRGVSALARENGTSVSFLSFTQLQDTEVVLPPGGLLIVDNLIGSTTQHDNAISLLTLYEEAMALDTTLVVASGVPPDQLQGTLPDLASRLSSGVSYQVVPLDDRDKRKALKQRATARGFELDDQVLGFIMRHFSRDTGSLFGLLDKLDSASLAHQRKITVPFVRSLTRRS